MKIVSIIFSFYILALVFSPVLDLFGQYPENQSCTASCSMVFDGENWPGEENGCNDICNPFMSCCTSLAYASFEIVLPGELPKAPHSVDTFYPQTIFSSFSHSIWHPPQLG